MFANPDLNHKLDIKKDSTNKFEKLLVSLQRGIDPSDGATVEMNYVESIFPREENSYLNKVRTRENFDFYGWKSSRALRSIMLTGSNSYGSSLVSSGVGG